MVPLLAARWQHTTRLFMEKRAIFGNFFNQQKTSLKSTLFKTTLFRKKNTKRILTLKIGANYHRVFAFLHASVAKLNVRANVRHV